MKIKTSFPYILKAALGILFINALSLTALAQGTNNVSKPGHEAYYEFDNGTWVHIHNTTNTYDADGQLTLALTTKPVTNQNLTKREYNNTITTQPTGVTRTGIGTNYTWQNNAWVITSMFGDILTQNASKQTTELIWQDLKNGALTNSRKKEYVYDAAGNLIDEIEYLWINNAWSNFQKRIYTYVQGIRTEQLIHIYNATTASWIPGVKFIYAGWHTPSQPTMITWQNKDASGNWTTTNRTTYTLGPNGNYGELSERFINNTWVLSSRSNVIYDTQRNRTDQILENYRNGAWSTIWHSKFLNTYSSQNDLEQLIIQDKDTVSGAFINEQKFVYSNFQYFNRALGTPENQKTELALNVYPNPATAKIQIQLAENKPQALTVSVKDITGKIWQTRTFKTGEEKQLNIEALPKGIYLLQLQTETGSIVKRIVKL